MPFKACSVSYLHVRLKGAKQNCDDDNITSFHSLQELATI